MTAPPAFEIVVKDELLKDAEIAAVVADRCYPGRRPQASVLPCLTYTVIGDPLAWGCWGISRLQVSCFALSYDTARALDLRVRAVLDEMAIDGTGIEIPGIDTDLPGMRTQEPDTGVYHHAIDCMVAYIFR